MSQSLWRTAKGKGLLAALALALLPLTCAKGLFTAAPGTSVTLFANPEFIAANGAVSVITAFLIQPAGTPVPDGTVVQFFTTLGRIDPQGDTKDGVARVNLVSDSRSGVATVTAVSGGPAVAAPSVAPSVTPSASPSASPVATPAPGAGTGTGSASTTVTIGSVLPARVVVVANPPRINGPGGATSIVANVFDANGNPVPNVPVIFTVSNSGAGGVDEFFDSGGQPIFTDNNGQAMDVMHTRRPSTDNQVNLTVTATLPNGVTGTTIVTVNALLPTPTPSP